MTIKDQIIYAMGEGREKAVHVPQNEAVTFFTRDCFNNQINSEEYVVDRLDWDHINPATVLKGMNMLVDAGLLEKRRGLGMFVRPGARQKIMERRKDNFYNDYVKKLLVEAAKLGITKEHLIELIERGEHDGTIKH